MATKKSKKQEPQVSEDSELLKSEVAAFASSLGLASSLPSSGFDDSDFRKTGPMKPSNHSKPLKTDKNPNLNSSNDQNSKLGEGNNKLRQKANAKKSPFENLDPFGTSRKMSSKHQKFPLMNASSLSGQWYTEAEELAVRVLGEKRNKSLIMGVDELKALVAKKKELAEKLLQQYTEDYHASRKKNRDMLMVENAVRSGTTADKVSALTCLVEDNPIANIKSIESLLHMVTTKVGKRYAFTSFDALKELFLFRLLPDHKLKSLLQRPLDSLPESKDGFSLLLFWYWEENLKKRYEQFVIALEEASKDMLPNLKEKAVKMIYSLLKSKSEQERRLLSTLVNKLGDPVRKSASGASYYLSCLLSDHPNMKTVVIDEVESFVFRPHVGLRAKYHAVNFLSQLFLTRNSDGPKLAKRLVGIYFDLFKVLISETDKSRAKSTNNKHAQKFGDSKKKVMKIKGNNCSQKKTQEPSSDSSSEMDSRLLSALLTGVNRAFPYVANDESHVLMEVQTPVLFKLVHSKNFNVGVQAFMLLYHITSKSLINSNNFYRALYAKLLSPAAMNSSKPEMFLGLLVRAMKTDINIKRIAAFAKRILQVSLHQPPQYACGCLFMLSEVLKARPPLWNLMLQNESVDEDLEHFEDIIEDPQDTEDTANLNKLQDPPNSFCMKDVGFLEDLPTLQEEKDMLDVPHKDGSNSGGDKIAMEQNEGPIKANILLYDPRKREPCYCNAESTSWWELTVLASHSHPSVATMARTLLSGASIVYNGDPLNDLSLVAFLDKLMEKKPKSSPRVDGAWHGGSQIAPAAKLDMNDRFVGAQILQLAEEDVPPEEVVFHKFYMNKTSSAKKMKKKKKKKASEDDEAADDLLGDGDSDESDRDDMDSMLDLEEEDKDYNYDDLDKVVNNDDDGLLEYDDDEGVGSLVDLDGASDSEDDDGTLEIEAENNETDEDMSDEPAQSRKRKPSKKSKVSPFASLEDYEHLLNDEVSPKKKPKLEKRTSNSGKTRSKSK